MKEKNDAEFIKQFLAKMRAQDNRATASPYFYVIRTKVTDPAPVDFCDEVRFYWNDSSWDSLEEIKEYCKENDLHFESIESEIKEYGVRYRWEKRGMFLTEDDAKDHLQRNHYHYSPDAHDYIEHAWRAPELTRFFQALHNYFGEARP